MVTLTVGAQKILKGTKPSLKGVNKIRLKIDFQKRKLTIRLSLIGWNTGKPLSLSIMQK